MRMLLLTLIAVACFARSLSELEYKNEFVAFVEKFEKKYEGVEYLNRFEIFKGNLDKISEINAKGLSWYAGVNQFTALTREEFGHWLRAQSAGFRPSKNKTLRSRPLKSAQASCSSKDWVAENRIAPIKNQGDCGSCWAFSTVGALEGVIAISNNAEPVQLSEMMLVDCSKQNSGCNGGLMDYAFEYVINNHGLCTEQAYPYTAPPKHWFCQSNNCDTSHGVISSYQDVSKDSNSLKTALCNGPVSVAIEADQDSFQLYSGGVFTGTCGDQLDHGVLAVGFGEMGGKGYWKVRNSWGTNWGMDGYILIGNDDSANGKQGNRCGILESASYPIV